MDAAQARAEELRRAEVDSRSRAGSLKWQLDTCRNKLKAASEETKEVRRAAKDALFFQAGSGAAGKTPFASRRRVEQAQHDHVAAHGGRPAAQGGEGLAGPEPRAWKGSLPGFARLGPCCRRRSTGARASSREKPRSGRKRGQQRGAAGHGRTQRPGLEERTEEHNPPKDARVCSCCAKPYVANGERSSTVIEIEVKAHTRRIVRPRWRRNCDCASSPLEVSAPPVARLFPNTP